MAALQGLLSPHPQVAEFCADALQACAAALQPREAPAGSRPVEVVATSTVSALRNLGTNVFGSLFAAARYSASGSHPLAFPASSHIFLGFWRLSTHAVRVCRRT